MSTWLQQPIWTGLLKIIFSLGQKIFILWIYSIACKTKSHLTHCWSKMHLFPFTISIIMWSRVCFTHCPKGEIIMKNIYGQKGVQSYQIPVNNAYAKSLDCLYGRGLQGTKWFTIMWEAIHRGSTCITVCLLMICKGFQGISSQSSVVATWGLVLFEIFAENHCISLVNWL